MTWNLQQINNANGQGPTVPGESMACPQAPASNAANTESNNLFVCAFGDQLHFAYLAGVGNIQDCWYDDASGWHLQQINNVNAQGPTVPGESVACPQATAPVPLDAPNSNLFVCAFGDQLHFAYLDGKGNIQDCWYDGVANQWNLQQINNGDGQGPTVPGEYVACPQATATPFNFEFLRLSACAFGDQQHFAYQDGNGNIQDCWYDDASGWHLQQINNGNGQGPTVPGEYVACPQATASMPLGGFITLSVCAFGDQQHFTYVDGNANLQDCWYDDASGWHLQQINNTGGHGPTVPGESIACTQATAGVQVGPFVCVFEDQLHFAYLDGNSNIQDCWYDGVANQWNLQQINNGNGQGPTVPGEYVACPQATAPAEVWPPTLSVCTFGDQQHFTYSDRNGNLQDCWYDDASGWHLQQINNTGGHGPTVPGESVACAQATAGADRESSNLFVCAFGDQQHFAYLDGNSNIQDCWYEQ